MNKKRHTKSPLPFQGQKRNWVKRLEELALQIPEGATVVDVFGGSGLCAHTIKSTRPDLRVIWNDYDNFKHRLDRIGQTNIFAREIYSITSGYAKGHISPPGKMTIIVSAPSLTELKKRGLTCRP